YAVTTRTYGEVAGKAIALAAALADAGVRPGDRVGCYVSNSPCWVVGSLGAWWAGAAIAAVGTLLPGPEAARLFALADVRVVAGSYARNRGYRPDPAPAHLAPGVVFNPFGHAAGFSRLAFRMWIGRATILVPKFSVAAVRAYTRRFAPDTLQLTPTMIHMLAT